MPYKVYISHECMEFEKRSEAREFVQGLFDNTEEGDMFITDPSERVIERYTRDGHYDD